MTEVKTSFKMVFFPIVFQNFWHENQYVIFGWALYKEFFFLITGACSGKPDSLDYDSGARDMSPEPASLQQLVESHNPRLLSIVQDDSIGMEILDVANRVSNTNPEYSSLCCMHIWTENCKGIALFGRGLQRE